MEFNTPLGLIIAFGMMLGAFLMEGGDPLGLLQVTAVMIVLGGTIGAILIAFPMKDIKKCLSMSKHLFVNESQNGVEIIKLFIQYSETARKEGILSLEQYVKSATNPLVSKGLRLSIDGITAETIKAALEREAHLYENEYHAAATVLEAAGGYSPTMGIIGTVLGLVSVLSNLSEPEELGHKIALAFIATLFGILFANVMWLPMANKLKVKGKELHMINDLVIEGILSIHGGENPSVLKEKLSLQLMEKLG